jgi:hypothetical protein
VIRARLQRSPGGGMDDSLSHLSVRIGEEDGSKDGFAEKLTSRWPARPVLLTTWQRSGGPSSRNVAEGVCVSAIWIDKWKEQPEGHY